MALACKICIAEKGLRGSEIASLPKTEEELFDHIEAVHHRPVVREGETPKEAMERFLKKHPDAASCQECIEAGAPWIGSAS